MNKPAIYILDTFSPRIIDTERHVFPFGKSVRILEVTAEKIDLSLSTLAAELPKSNHSMVIMNYVAAVKFRVLTFVRSIEPQTGGIRKILQTCKSREDVIGSLGAIGESLLGVRHLRWDTERVEKNREQFERIFHQKKK